MKDDAGSGFSRAFDAMLKTIATGCAVEREEAPPTPQPQQDRRRAAVEAVKRRMQRLEAARRDLERR